MRVLVFASCSEGLALPLVPLGWALRTAGHEVLVACPENMAPALLGAGLPVYPYTPAIDIPDVLRHDRQGNPVQRPPLTDELPMLAHIGRGYGRLAARFLPPALELARRWRPDMVVSEPQGLGGALVAAALDVPWVKLGISIGSLRMLEEVAFGEAAPELEQLGLSQFPEPAVFLDPCPESLQRADQPGTHRFRYLAYNGVAKYPDWALEERTRPRLCLTIGTRLPVSGDLPLLVQLTRNLADLDVELVIAVDEENAKPLYPLPEQVVVAGRVPLNLALPACDLAVHHGGTGTTMACLAAGIPTVTFPAIAEVWDFARRLDAFGAAIRIKIEELSAERVLAASTTILTDPSYRANAELLAKEVAALPTLAESVDVLERLI
jgi:UDP:flavonoid glycosyltransferase YjiC (YdhE family)